ncbi:MAG: HAMP domain-containing histidine kinase [Planctomycetes bacterium]|nr:HAMP domain-containing histidine kinase [Planctomycetota bacterium]
MVGRHESRRFSRLGRVRNHRRGAVGDGQLADRGAGAHERLRLALWRLDSWLAPQLAREAMRPARDFRAFPSASAAWTRGLMRLGSDEVVFNSPLLGVEPGLFALHFELGPEGIVSPQVPQGNERDVCEANGIDRAVLDRAAQRLAEFERQLDRDALLRRQGIAEAQLPMMGCNAVPPEAPAQTQQSVAEFSNRQRSVQNVFAPQQQAADNTNGQLFVGALQSGNVPSLNTSTDQVGPMTPIWLDGEVARLVFVRRVTSAGVQRLQGAVVDWARMQQELLAQVADLFAPGAQLVRCDQPDASEQPSMLASIPVRLIASCPGEIGVGLPLPWMLASVWGITLLGLAMLGFTLRAAIGYGERRARFASAVTHELRTPLTTFRMYSEMLADGVVTEPAAQREYLGTLQRESDRLARVVENVLAWSRLEEGRFRSRRETHRLAALLERVTPPLQRRLQEVELELVVQWDPAFVDTEIATDEDAVGQILFNLVDNAAKYARDAVDRRVELQVAVADDRVVLTLRDHGPGVPAAMRARIFAPFDRGAVAAGDNDVPGVGLGLSLARGLARDLGGELRLEAGGGAGAAFSLVLPR